MNFLFAIPSPPLPSSGESNILHFACSLHFSLFTLTASQSVSPLGASYKEKMLGKGEIWNPQFFLLPLQDKISRYQYLQKNETELL